MVNLQNCGQIKKQDIHNASVNNTNTQICTNLRKYSPLFKHLNRPKIDSLRIRIPYNKVIFIDEELGVVQGRFNYETAEIFQKEHPVTGELVDDTSVVYSKYVETNGIKTRYAIRSVFEGPCVGNQQYVVVGLNAKMLQGHYFRGVSSDTIRLVWEYIVNQGIIYTDFQTFINSKISDVDICIDKYTLEILGDNEFTREMTCKRIVEMSRTAAKNKDNTQGWTQIKNTGIEFGDRQKVGRRYRTKQYLKFYAKLVELEHNERSKEFKETYLDTTQIEAYDYHYFLRVETTIKNAAHFQIYDIEVRTLKDLLRVSASAMRQFIQCAINMHLNALKHQVPAREGFTPMEKMSLFFLKPYLVLKLDHRRKIFGEDQKLTDSVIEAMTKELVVRAMGDDNHKLQTQARWRMRQYLSRVAKEITLHDIAMCKNSEIALLEKLQLTPPVLVDDDQHTIYKYVD